MDASIDGASADAPQHDATAAFDATATDARVADAVVADTGPPDARPPGGPGELCGTAPNWCVVPLDCWVLLESSTPICTQPCITAAECTAPGYGTDPCCAPPGSQTLETVCIPRGDPACDGDAVAHFAVFFGSSGPS